MNYILSDDVSLIPLSGGTSLKGNSLQRGYQDSDDGDVQSGGCRDDSLPGGDGNESLDGGEGDLCGDQRLRRDGK